MNPVRRLMKIAPITVILLSLLGMWSLIQASPVIAGITPTPTFTPTLPPTDTPSPTPTPMDTPTVTPTETPMPTTQEPGPQPSPTSTVTPTPAPLLPETGVVASTFLLLGLWGLLFLALGGLILVRRRA